MDGTYRSWYFGDPEPRPHRKPKSRRARGELASPTAPDPLALWVPMVEEGARGIAFVGAALTRIPRAAAGSTSS